MSGEDFACQHKIHRCGLDPWVEKISWRRKWQPTPVFLPRKSHGQRILTVYTPWGHESDMTEWLSIHIHKEEVRTYNEGVESCWNFNMVTNKFLFVKVTFIDLNEKRMGILQVSRSRLFQAKNSDWKCPKGCMPDMARRPMWLNWLSKTSGIMWWNQRDK